MQLSANRPRLDASARLSNEPMYKFMTKNMMQRALAAEAAFVICGGISEDEVFVSDVLDVAAFLLVDDVVDASIVCGYRDGELECCLNDGHASILGRTVDVNHLGHVTSSGAVFHQEVF